MYFSSGGNDTQAKSGTYVEPSQQAISTDPGPRSLPDDLQLMSLPRTHTQANESVDPPSKVTASTGAQTMTVETTSVDGEPALVLEDEQTHDGRWVSVPVSWYEDALGQVPSRAYVRHSSGREYTTPTHTRGSSVAFYVRGFSSNTVTFSGEVSISALPAADGSTYEYDIANLDAASDATVNLTGITNTEWDNVSAASLSDGSTIALDVAGNSEPTGPSTNNNPVVTFTGIGSYYQTLFDSTSNWRNGTLNGVKVENSVVQLWKGYHDIVGDEGDGISDNERAVAGQNYYSGGGGGYEKARGSVEFVPETDMTAQSLDLNISKAEGGGYDPNVDIYISQSGADKSFGEGTLVKSNWNPTWSTGQQSVSLGTSYDLQKGATYEVEFVTRSTVSDTTTHYIYLGTDTSASTTKSVFGQDTGTSEAQEYGDIDIVGSSGGSSGSYESATRSFGADASFVNATISATIPSGGGIDATVTNGAGETVTESLSDGSNTVDLTTLSKSENVSIDFSISGDESTQPSVDAVEIHKEKVTDSPGLDIDDDGTNEASVSGTLSDGQTASKELSTLSTSDDSGTISTAGGAVDIEVSLQERTQTVDPGVGLNGHWANQTGSLSDGETVSLTINKSSINSGTNNVRVSIGDGTLSTDAPNPVVNLEFSHEASDKVVTNYSSTKWLEEYNVSKTWSSNRTGATLTIPHAGDVLSVQRVEMQVNNGGWSPVEPAAYSLDNTELTIDIGNVTAGDTVDIRTTGSLAQTHNGTITVLQPTTPGNRLNSRIAIDSWADTSYIEVPKMGSWNRVHYTNSESWSADESVRILASGEQRLRLPNAAAGMKANVSTIPVEAMPASGDVVVSVGSVNFTEPKFSVRSGETIGNDVEFTFINATDGAKYNLYSLSSEVVIDSGTASSPLTLSDDDSAETLQFLLEDSSSSSSSDTGESGGGTGIMATAGNGNANLVPLGAIALSIGALIVVSRRDETVQEAGQGAASSVEGVLDGVPVVGPLFGRTAAGLIRGSAQMARAAVGNRTIALSLAAALGLGAVQAGWIALPEGSLVLVMVAVVAALAFVGLRELGEFSLQRWTVIVMATTIVSLQVLSDTSLLAAIVNSRAWPIIVAGALYLGYKLVQGIRAPDKTQEVIIETDGGNN
jgi:hypothetical protein